MIVRLEREAPDLARWVSSADPAACRRAAFEAARLAAEETSLTDPRAKAALAVLEAGEVPGEDARSDLALMEAELDEQGWALADRADAEGHARYEAAFRRARAASAIVRASEPEPRSAAYEALYETHASSRPPAEPAFCSLADCESGTLELRVRGRPSEFGGPMPRR